MRGYENLNYEHNQELKKEKNVIKTIRSEKVTPTESHFEIEVNGKLVQFAKWVDDDFCTDYEILKMETELTEEEYDLLTDFIEESVI